MKLRHCRIERRPAKAPGVRGFSIYSAVIIASDAGL